MLRPVIRTITWTMVGGLGLCLSVAAQQARPASWSQGAYIWDSAALLDPRQCEAELSRLERQGIDQLLVGLNSQQVRAGAATTRALQRALVSAHKRGMRVSLLLGDPEWIEERGRPALQHLIQRYRQLAFDGLHLDLELEQLGWPVPSERIRQWLATLRAVQTLSPWPLSISSHPRWFEARASTTGQQDQPCLACELSQMSQRRRLNSITLMLYQRPPERVTERSLAIIQRWPQLNFRIAQSVESTLPPAQSWHGRSARALQMQVERWRGQLESSGLGGIDWQDWHNYPKEE